MRETIHRLLPLLNRISDIVVLSLLWTVCSLPLFTLGAASAALYYATVRAVRQESAGGAIPFFFASFRLNFRQATAYTLVALLILAVLAGTIWAFSVHDMGLLGAFYTYLSLGLLALSAMFVIQLFPLIGRFRMGRADLMRASITLIRIGFGKTLLLLLALAFLEAMCVFYPPCLLFASGCYAYIAAEIQEPLFRRIIRFEDPLDEPDAEPSE